MCIWNWASAAADNDDEDDDCRIVAAVRADWRNVPCHAAHYVEPYKKPETRLSADLSKSIGQCLRVVVCPLHSHWWLRNRRRWITQRGRNENDDDVKCDVTKWYGGTGFNRGAQ